MLGVSLNLPKIDTGPFVFGAKPVATSYRQSFGAFIERANPTLLQFRHIAPLVDALQAVADGDLTRLMVFQPPRHFKSELVSRLFSAYYLRRHPDYWVGLTSYAAQLAYTLSRNARDYYGRSGGKFNPDKTGVEQWETDGGGGLWAAGVGGPITGLGFHLGIIDDPIKNAEEAASETIRAKHRDWYQSTFYTRMAPNAAIIDIQTRWNEDDLSGWLLAQEGSEDDLPEQWHIVNLPAIAEAPRQFPVSCTVAPDTRQPGDALCPERYSVERLKRIEQRIGPYFFASLYQQRPTPLEGGLFKRAWFATFVDAIPAGCQWVRYWDAAATPGGGDWSVGVLMGRTPGNRYVVADVIRGQWSSAQRIDIVQQTAKMDRLAYGHVAINGEQEPGSSGKDMAVTMVTNLAGYSVHYERVTGDKLTRAMPFAAQVEVGNVDLLTAPWNKAYLDELTMFPNGKHDDQVDASSGAFNALAIGSGVAMRQAPVRGRGGRSFSRFGARS